MALVADVELHDEVVTWMFSLEESGWQRTLVVIDRLAGLGPAARMPNVQEPRRRVVRAALHARPNRSAYHLPITSDGRIVLLTTFRKQRQNERTEMARARKAAEACARLYP